MINTILSFLAKGTLFFLKSCVILAGVGAVVFVILFVLKFIVGALAKALGVGGSSGGSGGGIGSAIGGMLGTVNRGINGVFTGIGTAFNGVANTTGMVRDKVLGGGRNYNDRYNRRNDYYGNDYDHQDNSYRNRKNRRKQYNDAQIYNSKDGLYNEEVPISQYVGNPNDPNDRYYTTKRYYDEDGFDQFGFDKSGKHKEEIMKELLKKDKKEKGKKFSDLYQDKKFSDSEIANKWIKDARFKKPSTWAFGAAGLTYAAAHGIAKGLNKDVPDDWEKIENRDSGIQKTVDMTQQDIDEADERKYDAPIGGVNAETLVKETKPDTEEVYVEEDDMILNSLSEVDKKQKEKEYAYAGVSQKEQEPLKAKTIGDWDTSSSLDDDSLDDLNLIKIGDDPQDEVSEKRKTYLR